MVNDEIRCQERNDKITDTPLQGSPQYPLEILETYRTRQAGV